MVTLVKKDENEKKTGITLVKVKESTAEPFFQTSPVSIQNSSPAASNQVMAPKVSVGDVFKVNTGSAQSVTLPSALDRLKNKTTPLETIQAVKPNVQLSEFGKIVQGLDTTSEKLTAGEGELSTLERRLRTAGLVLDNIVSKYGAQEDEDGKLVFPTQEGLDAYKSGYEQYQKAVQQYQGRYQQYQQDAKQYQGYLDQYNGFVGTTAQKLTSAEINAKVQDLNQEIEALEREKSEKTGNRMKTGLTLSQSQALAKQYDEKIAKLTSERDALSVQYHTVENQEKQEALKKDTPMLSQYTSAQDLQADMDKITSVITAIQNKQSTDQIKADQQYLMEKYGLSKTAVNSPSYESRTDAGNMSETYGSLKALYEALEQQKKSAIDALDSAGYNYSRMTGYEQMLKDAEEYAKKQEEWQQYAKEHPFISSANTVLLSPLQGADFAKLFISNLGHNDPSDPANYVPLNVYNMDITNFVGTVRGTVSKEIEERTDWELFGQNVGSFLYQTGMSIADSAVQVATMGEWATLLMGASAASNEAKDIIERGGTNNQAFWGGLAAGAAEAVFEKVSIDQLLSAKSVTGWKSWLKETAKQAGVEASEETFTEIANILSDAAIMGEKSNFAMAVEQYKAEGMSEEVAKKKAYLDCVAQVAWAGVGGALSGGIMGGSVNAANAVGTMRINAALSLSGKELREANANFDLVELGLNYAQDSETYKQAEKIASALNQGSGQSNDNIATAVTDADYGRLRVLMAQEAQSKGPQSTQVQAQVQQAVHPEAKVMGESAQAFMDAGDSAAVADRKGDIMERVLAGDTTLTDTQLRKLDLQSESTWKAITALTGVEAPATTSTKARLAAVRKIVDDVASVQAQQAEAEARAAAQVWQMEQEAAAMAEEVVSRARTVQQTPVAQEEQVQAEQAAPTAQRSAASAFRSKATQAQVEQTTQTASASQRNAAQAFQPKAKQSQKTTELTGVQMSDGTTRSAQEFVEGWLANHPGASQAEANTAYSDAVRLNQMGLQYPAVGTPEARSSVSRRQRTAQGHDTRAQAAQTETKAGPRDTETSGQERAAESRQEAESKARTSAAKNTAKTSAETTEPKSSTVDSGVRAPSKTQEWTARYATAMLKGSRIKGVDIAFDGFAEGENGYYVDGRIVLNGNRLTSQRAIVAILGHELTHSGYDADNSLVDDILDFGEHLYGAQEMERRMGETRDRYIEFYMRQKGLSDEQARAKVDLGLLQQEVAGDLMAEVFASTSDALGQMAEQKPGLLRSALDTAKRLMSNLSKRLIRESEAEQQRKALRNEAEWLVHRLEGALRNSEQGSTMESKEARSSVEADRLIDELNRLDIDDYSPIDSKLITRVYDIPEIVEVRQRSVKNPKIDPGWAQAQQNALDTLWAQGSWDGANYAGEVRKERRADIVIGLPGSGKSSIAVNPLSQAHGSRVIDSDQAKELLPGYDEGKGAGEVHNGSSEVRDKLLELAVVDGENIVWPTVGEKRDKLDKSIKKLRKNGYQVYLHLVDVTPKQSLARALRRFLPEDGSPGRYVNPGIIQQAGNGPKANFEALRKEGKLDGYEYYDNRVFRYLRDGRGDLASDSEDEGANRIPGAPDESSAPAPASDRGGHREDGSGRNDGLFGDPVRGSGSEGNEGSAGEPGERSESVSGGTASSAGGALERATDSALAEAGLSEENTEAYGDEADDRRGASASAIFEGVDITQEEIARIAETEEFKNWFHDGNGELIDPKTGLPRVVFHGTSSAGFTRFIYGDNSEPGFFFAGHPHTSTGDYYVNAEQDENGERVVEEYVPKTLRTWAEAERFVKKYYRDMRLEKLPDGKGYLYRNTLAEANTDDVVGHFSATEKGLERFNRLVSEITPYVDRYDAPNYRRSGLLANFLSMKKPLVLYCEGRAWNSLSPYMTQNEDVRKAMIEKYDTVGKLTGTPQLLTNLQTRYFTAVAQELGYDGVIFRDVLDGRIEETSGMPLLRPGLQEQVDALMEKYGNFGYPDEDMAQVALENGWLNYSKLPGITAEEVRALNEYTDAMQTSYPENEAVPDDVYVVFDAAQIKSVHNEGSFDPENPDIRYSVSSSMPFAEQVDRALSEDLNENRFNALYIAQTPSLLRGVGLGDLPLCITAKHIQNANAPEVQGRNDYHGIDAEVLKRLPELLAEPVMILDSRSKVGDIVVVTSEVDGQGRPIIVSIHPNGAATVDGKNGPANFITSVYGRNKFNRFIDTSALHGQVLYWNKKRTQQLAQKAQASSSVSEGQQPTSVPQVTKSFGALSAVPSDTIIRQHTGYVKENIPERRFSVDEDTDTDINPETGYRTGSLADSIMQIWVSGEEGTALDRAMELAQRLEKIYQEEQARIRRGRARETRNAAAAFMPRPKLTESAIEKNRREINELIDRFGKMEQTGAAQRGVNFPNAIDEETNVRGFVQTAAATTATPEYIVSEIERDIVNGDASATYKPVGDAETLNWIEKKMKNLRKTKGPAEAFESALRDWRAVVDGNGFPTKRDVALGEQLYLEAAQNGDVQTAMQLLGELAAVGTQSGQVIQAMSMIKKMTPSGQLYYLTKAADRLAKSSRRMQKRGETIIIDNQLALNLLEANTQEELDAAIEAIMQNIADQIPATVADKWNAWRYLSMLGNPRTHIRNILGNAVFAPVRFVKDVMAYGLEHLVIRDKSKRTKGIATREAREFAKQDAQEMKEILRGGGKHNPSDAIMDKRRIFKAAPLEWLRKGNSAALEAEDWLFLKGAYERALAGFISARGADVATLAGPNSTREGRALLAEARNYAVQEAQKATYRDMSKVAATLNQLKRKHPALDILLNGVVPFTKTPINIVKRGFEYSPLGLAQTISKAVKKESAAEIIDSLSANLTGTGVALVGWLLARMGLLVAGLGDDPEDEFKKLQGAQEYSFQINGKSITIDWMAPGALPLFVGAEFARQLEELEELRAEGELTEAEMIQQMLLENLPAALMGTFEPMLSLSMLDGINDVLSANRYDSADSAVINIVKTMATNYFTQSIPTIGGQIARTIDDSRRTAFTEAGTGPVQSWLQRTWQSSVLAKIPVKAEERMLYIDAWGRTDTEESIAFRAVENFLCPGYISDVYTSPMEEELQRLAEAIGNTSVYPKRADKSFTVGGETYAMSQDEYQDHLIERGQLSYELVTDIVHSRTYAGMSDAERARAVTNAYTYAAELAKLHTNQDYNASAWVRKLEGLVEQGIDPADYLLADAKADINDLNIRNVALADESMDDRTKALIYSSTYTIPKSFADPIRTGYQYTMDEEFQDQFASIFQSAFVEEFQELTQKTKYLNADQAEREELVSDLQSEVAADTRKEIAKLLRATGQKSTKTD